MNLSQCLWHRIPVPVTEDPLSVEQYWLGSLSVSSRLVSASGLCGGETPQTTPAMCPTSPWFLGVCLPRARAYLIFSESGFCSQTNESGWKRIESEGPGSGAAEAARKQPRSAAGG